MIDFDKIPIVSGLKSYKEKNMAVFHMPGHKQNKGLIEELEYIRENLYDFDITEIEGSDNLHSPEGIIKEGMELLAKSMKSKKSYYLVNGSTCGVYSMMLGLFNRGDKVIIQRNCHKSVYSALELGDLTAEYIYPKVIDNFGILSGIDYNDLKKIVEKNNDAKGLVITSPSYFGTCSDIEKISKLCKKNDILLLVDEAHGAHFSFSKMLPSSAISLGADVSVTSFHKTLPSLTQTAVLNVSKNLSDKQIAKIEEKMKIFQTTSPSYLFLASMDMARYIMDKDGERLIGNLVNMINDLKESLKDIKQIRFLEENDINEERIDSTRIVINTPVDGEKLSDILREKYQIQIEMSYSNNIVLIGSPLDSKEVYDRLKVALREIFSSFKDNDTTANKKIKLYNIPPIVKLTQREIDFEETIDINLEASEGTICAETIVPYPPGVPIILPGEEISRELIDFIIKNNILEKNLIRSSNLSSGKIRVIA